MSCGVTVLAGDAARCRDGSRAPEQVAPGKSFHCRLLTESRCPSSAQNATALGRQIEPHRCAPRNILRRLRDDPQLRAVAHLHEIITARAEENLPHDRS